MANNRTNILLLMAKAPQMGAVKTRLAREVGDLRAWRFYRGTLTSVGRQLSKSGQWTTKMFVSPDQFARPSRLWPIKGAPRSQKTGDLGHRMLRGLKSGRKGQSIALIGCDIPGVTPAHIRKAFRKLAHADVVFGPSPDGGFWLLGWNGRRPLFRPFLSARWSSRHALNDCLSNLRHRRVALVDQLSDVDTAEEFRSL